MQAGATAPSDISEEIDLQIDSSGPDVEAASLDLEEYLRAFLHRHTAEILEKQHRSLELHFLKLETDMAGCVGKLSGGNPVQQTSPLSADWYFRSSPRQSPRTSRVGLPSDAAPLSIPEDRQHVMAEPFASPDASHNNSQPTTSQDSSSFWQRVSLDSFRNSFSLPLRNALGRVSKKSSESRHDNEGTKSLRRLASSDQSACAREKAESIAEEVSRESRTQLSMRASQNEEKEARMRRGSPIKYCALSIINHKLFDTSSALCIISNALFIGVQAQCCSKPGYRSEAVDTLQMIYTVIFLLELVLRITALRCEFFYNEDYLWNMVDFTIVVISIMEVAMENALGDGTDTQSFTMVRMVRAMRVIRILRIVRIFRFFRDLRLLVLSILSALKSLFWAVMLLAIIMYGFAVIFTQAIMGETKESVTSDRYAIKFYSTVPRSMYTLFLSIAGGISWNEVVEPLSKLHGFYVTLFISYVAFIVFAVLNVVTGVFCQNAIESAARDEQEVVDEMVRQKKTYTDRLHMLFSDMQAYDGQGCVSIVDFERKLTDDRVKAWFRMLDLEVNDAWTLFRLLDADHTGLVDVEEFVSGCMTLKGAAKSLEVAKLSQETKMIFKHVEGLTRQLETVATAVEEIHRNGSRLQRTMASVSGARPSSKSNTGSASLAAVERPSTKHDTRWSMQHFNEEGNDKQPPSPQESLGDLSEAEDASKPVGAVLQDGAVEAKREPLRL